MAWFFLKTEKKKMPKENDLEGVQDQGGKHGGQAGVPKPVPRPPQTQQDQKADAPKSTKR
jgi:hypothetical protein